MVVETGVRQFYNHALKIFKSIFDHCCGKAAHCLRKCQKHHNKSILTAVLIFVLNSVLAAKGTLNIQFFFKKKKAERRSKYCILELACKDGLKTCM